jgi:hypothetical protein
MLRHMSTETVHAATSIRNYLAAREWGSLVHVRVHPANAESEAKIVIASTARFIEQYDAVKSDLRACDIHFDEETDTTLSMLSIPTNQPNISSHLKKFDAELEHAKLNTISR